MHNLYVFGTVVNITFKPHKKVQEEILKLLYDLDDLCSVYKENSDISKINGADNYVKVDKKVYEIIKKSIKYSKETDGYGDITIKPLLDAIKEKGNVKQALKLVNYQNIMLKSPNLVKLKESGMKLDLGSMVKGYASDMIVNILNKYGINDAIIDLGGNVFVKGLNNGVLWKVGIQDPFKKTGISLGYINLSNKSVVTSGTNERKNHIVNPKNGKVAKSIKSITIIADKSFDAEGLSTGCFVLGLKSLNLLNKMKGINAIIIDNHKNIYITNNFKDKFILTNKRYHIKEMKKWKNIKLQKL